MKIEVHHLANTAIEGTPVLLRIVLNAQGQTVQEEWVVETQGGYLTTE